MLPENYDTVEVFSSNHVVVYSVKSERIIVVKSIKEYIPDKEFKNIFNHVTEISKKTEIEKVIFDKRSLRIFHPQSMEWYFLIWKEEIKNYNVTMHRKILPNDSSFVNMVEVFRETLYNKYPRAAFQKLDIQYSSSIKDAIES